VDAASTSISIMESDRYSTLASSAGRNLRLTSTSGEIRMAKKDIVLARQSLPWERQHKESEEAFYAFSIYRDMDPLDRHKNKVAVSLEKSVTLIQRWASNWNWDNRVREYDNYMETVKMTDRLKKIRDMNEKHLKICYGIQQKAAQALAKVDVDELAENPDEVLRMFMQSAELERKIMSQPNEQTAQLVQTAKAEEQISLQDEQRIQAIKDTIDALKEAGVLERVTERTVVEADYRIIEPCETANTKDDKVHAEEPKSKADGVLPTG
jgi:hypothetical protein